jgi:hypothetical protein
VPGSSDWFFRSCPAGRGFIAYQRDDPTCLPAGSRRALLRSDDK